MACNHSENNKLHTVRAVALAFVASGGLGLATVPPRSLSHWRAYLTDMCRSLALPCYQEGDRGRSIMISDEHLCMWFGEEDFRKLRMPCTEKSAEKSENTTLTRPRTEKSDSTILTGVTPQCSCLGGHADPKYRCRRAIKIIREPKKPVDPEYRCSHEELGYSPLHSLSAVAPLFGVTREALTKRKDLPVTHLLGRPDKKKRGRLERRILVSDPQVMQWITLASSGKLFNDYQGERPKIPDGPITLACGYVLDRQQDGNS